MIIPANLPNGIFAFSIVTNSPEDESVNIFRRITYH